jgi:hypothetical protein
MHVFFNGREATALTHMKGADKTVRVFFVGEDGVPLDIQPSKVAEVLAYSNADRSTLAHTYTVVVTGEERGYGQFLIPDSGAGDLAFGTYYLYGRRTDGSDIKISFRASTLLVR